MDFESAISCMKKGERIKRSHWKSAYLKIDGKRIKMCMGFKKPWCYQFKDYDIFANDWLIDTSMAFVDTEDYNGLKPLTGKLDYN